jgi:hypothetical protein
MFHSHENSETHQKELTSSSCQSNLKQAFTQLIVSKFQV